jgi:hypothetical protein
MTSSASDVAPARIASPGRARKGDKIARWSSLHTARDRP